MAPVTHTFIRTLPQPDIDNRELERVKREAKREEEWERRAQAIDREEATVVHHLKVEETKKKKEKRLKADKCEHTCVQDHVRVGF